MNKENKQTGSRYPLFEHMLIEYDLRLLDSQIDDIALIAAEINGIKFLREELEKLRIENQNLSTKNSDLISEIENGVPEATDVIEALRLENSRIKRDIKRSVESFANSVNENIKLTEENKQLAEFIFNSLPILKDVINDHFDRHFGSKGNTESIIRFTDILIKTVKALEGQGNEKNA